MPNFKSSFVFNEPNLEKATTHIFDKIYIRHGHILQDIVMEK